MSDYIEAQAEIHSLETEQPIVSDKCGHAAEAMEMNIRDLPRTYWLIVFE